MRLIWLLADVPNVWLLVRFGRASQKIPYIRAHYYVALVATFVLCFVGHLCYRDTGAYMGGTQSAYIINYVMSVLFVFLYFDRPDAKGLSYGGAWTKMLGTAFLSLANIPVWPQDPRAPPYFLSTSSPHAFFRRVLYFPLETSTAIGGKKRLIPWIPRAKAAYHLFDWSLAMPSAQKLDTHHKALTLNLDASVFGSFAEIGAGQEVARWFFVVGGASATVAKTISAYDKEVSDDLYGAGTRYVSKQRLEAMLDGMGPASRGVKQNPRDRKRASSPLSIQSPRATTPGRTIARLDRPSISAAAWRSPQRHRAAREYARPFELLQQEAIGILG